MSRANNSHILEGIQSGSIIPYLGPGALKGVTSVTGNNPIPADNESLILAMTDGQPMSPRLMYEFPRAAMHVENKKGRKFLDNFLKRVYAETQWKESELHRWLAEYKPPYVIDVNRDLQLQTLYNETSHTLIVGISRIAAHPLRFDVYEYTSGGYSVIEVDQVNTDLPIIFKPLGSPLPNPNFIASDADFVDYITELMGGFAIPSWIKEYRQGKQYLFLGMRFTRDTERMVMSDIIYGANSNAGWAYVPNPTDKEKRFLAKKNIQLVEQDWTDLLDRNNSDAA